MPKLKRGGDAERGATDFIESLDRGLRVLELFGAVQNPMLKVVRYNEGYRMRPCKEIGR